MGRPGSGGRWPGRNVERTDWNMGQGNIYRSTIQSERSRPGHDTGRDKHHCAALLAYLRELNRTTRYLPSTAELTRDGRFGLRPPNRCNDLIHGRFDGHHYDIERTNGYGRGEFRWRLHEPARAGYPQNKDQAVLPLEA